MAGSMRKLSRTACRRPLFLQKTRLLSWCLCCYVKCFESCCNIFFFCLLPIVYCKFCKHKQSVVIKAITFLFSHRLWIVRERERMPPTSCSLAVSRTLRLHIYLLFLFHSFSVSRFWVRFIKRGNNSFNIFHRFSSFFRPSFQLGDHFHNNNTYVAMKICWLSIIIIIIIVVAKLARGSAICWCVV